jgi:hypothetical protein
MSIQRKRPPKPERQFPTRSVHAANATMSWLPNMRADVADRPPTPKTPDRKQQSIRDSARGEECTVRITGVCNGDPATTVWSHAPFGAAGKGAGLKALDAVGSYCCAACHDVVDGRVPRPAGMTREQVLLDWFFGMARSLVRLRQKGLL